MFESKILSSMTNPIFSAKAFADYCKAREENYKDLIAVLTSAFDYGLSLSSPTILTDIDNYVRSTSKFSPNAWIPLQAGYTQINELVHNILKMDLQEGDVLQGVTVEQEYDVDDPIINIVNGLGVSSPPISYSEVVDSMQADLHSLTCLTAAFNAFTTDSVSDRLSSFRDYISRTFQNGFTDFSSSAGYMANLLEKCNTVEELAAQVYNSAGYKNTTDESSSFVLSQSDLCQFTGASPAGPLDFSSVASATATVIKTGAKVVGGILVGLAKGAAKLFKATTQKVVEIVSDPYDICILDSGAKSYTVDGFFMEQVPDGTYWIADNNVEDTPSYELFWVMNEMWSSEYNNSQPKSFKFDLVFGEVLVEGFHMDWGKRFQSSEYNSFGWKYDRLILKLKPVRRSVASELLNYLKSNIYSEGFIRGSVEDILPIIQRIQNTPLVNADVDETEEELFLSFVDSYICLHCLLQFAFFESDLRREWAMYGVDDPDTTEVLIVSPFKNGEVVLKPDFIIDGSNVTNKHFATLCCYPDQVIDTGALSLNSSMFPKWAGLLMGMHKIEEFLYPFDYGFLPYSKDCIFSEPRFEIKTDQRNQDTFNTFVTTAIIVAVVAVVATVALVKVSKVARRAKMQFTGLQRSLENKLADGTATKADFKAYKRAKKKVRLTSLFSNGMQQAGSASLSNSIMPSDELSTSDVAALICG